MVLAKILQLFRLISSAFFYNFGLHCARNQIRVIIISDLVITSLLYPALAIYFSSQPLSHYSTRLHDSLFALNAQSAAYRTDLHDIWQGYDTIRITEAAGTQARCGAERTVRLERVLVPSMASGHPSGALNVDTVRAMYQLTTDIDHALEKYKKDLPCITLPDSPRDTSCLVAGPLLHRPYSPAQMSEDYEVIAAINSERNASKYGLHFEPEMTLAGRGSLDGKGWIVEADHLVLTYFFIEDDCHGNAGHSIWLQALKEAMPESAKGTHLAAQPSLVALEYDLAPPRNRFSLVSVLLYVAYLVVFVHFSGSLKRMDSIHSRYGIAFTGIVEIIASTVTSVSVCALWGFHVTMVPWGILPVLIVFVGAENMFILVQEVVSTPIILPVKERIGIGLSRAGTSNTLKCITYSAIFGTMAVFSSGAIRQFCIFTVVVLVAHWFLIHTFFVAVLAIDLYRLDLADLIRQGPNIEPSALDPKQIEEMVKKELNKRPVGTKIFRRGRAAKNGSLILMLAIAAGLYYASYPLPHSARQLEATSVQHSQVHSTSVMPPKPTSQTTAKESEVFSSLMGDDRQSAARAFWQTFNPRADSLLHLRIEPPSIIAFHPSTSDNTHHAQYPHFSRRFLRTLRPLIWTIKIIILPMSCTALALYALMRYLLKDADLSDAQDGRPEATTSTEGENGILDTTRAVDPSISFSALPRAFASDVEFGAASRDGSVVAAISIDNHVVVWMREQGTHQAIDLTLLVGAASNGEPLVPAMVTSVALDERGSRCAIGMEDGLVVSWVIAEGFKSRTFVRLTLNPIANLVFFPPLPLPSAATSGRTTPTAGPPAGPSKIRNAADSDVVLVTHENGEAFTWDPSRLAQPRLLKTSRSKCETPPSVAMSEGRGSRIAFALEGGAFEVLVRSNESESRDGWKSCSVVDVGESEDTITLITSGSFNVGPTYRHLVAVATQSGQVTVWNGDDGTLVASLDDTYGEVHRLSLAPRPWKACPHCGEMAVDEFTLVLSIGPDVYIHRAMIPLQEGRCSCPMSQMLLSAAMKISLRDKLIRSRSGSVVSASASASASSCPSPAPHRVGLPSTNQTLAAPDYPVPGHGYHSRRMSDNHAKDRSRNSIETQSDDMDFSGEFVLKDPFATVSKGPPLSPLKKALWNNLRINLVAAVPCDRGDWSVMGSNVVGIRRRTRTQPKSTPLAAKPHPRSAPTGEGVSPLARWELWIYDTEDCTPRASPLASLEVQTSPIRQIDDTKSTLAPPASASTLTRRHQNLKRLMDIKNSDPLSETSTTHSLDRIHPRLPFTRVNCVATSGQTILAGCGNTVGVLDFSTYAANSRSRKSSTTSPAGTEKKIL